MNKKSRQRHARLWLQLIGRDQGRDYGHDGSFSQQPLYKPALEIWLGSLLINKF